MKKLLKVGLDWDDTLCPFVTHAIHFCNKENGTAYTNEDITEWGNNTEATKMVFPYYSDIRTYQRQQVSESTKRFVQKLQEVADVYIITAIQPQYMGIRAEQIAAAFPGFPEDHILMGAAKNLIKLDVLLDDAPHNILKSSATYPVLIRRPWNQRLSGVLAVNSLDEFLVLIDQIIHQMTETDKVDEPCIYAIVGPSGAQKHKLADQIVTYKGECSCQKVQSIRLSNDISKPENAITDTVYAGCRYTLDRSQIEYLIDRSTSAVVVVDICGAIALKRSFPTVIIFCRQSRETMIENVLSDLETGSITKLQGTMQLLSMEQELRNEVLCDYSVRSDDNESIKKLLSQI